MDPVTAVSLAGTVVQFVTFACSLLSKTSEIHNSVTGRSADLTNILTVYEHLQAFGTKLATQESIIDASQVTSNGLNDAEETAALKEILQAARRDCNQILKLVENISAKNAPLRRWNSFKAALELVWKRDEIQELEKRLRRSQSALTLHMCALTSRFHESYQMDFRKLRTTCELYQIKHEATIEKFFKILQEIEIRYLPTRPSGDKIEPQNIPLVQPQDIDELGQQLNELSLTAKSLSQQQSIICSLNFEDRPLRHDSIPEAHDRTFGWVHRPERLKSHYQLLQWLRTGSGIFWVSGKPGSGKSTFMKYLADDGRTRSVLAGWAQPQTILTASHYFWIAGSVMQKSRQGLLQQLLMQVLRQQPELAISVSPERLSNTNASQTAWSTTELRRALKRVAESNLGVKLCLFIDGLDEYSGDHHELCQDLHQLVCSGKIKICLSSRPWNVFEDAFGGCSSTTLRIHELTQSDIQAYAKSRLSEHARWDNLHDQPRSGELLISEVIQRAHGVFLWVFLVTKLLREGLTNDDSFTDLLKRLEQFPSDLEPFFKHMLNSVEPFYHPKMSGLLQIAVAAKKPLRYLFYKYYEDEYDDQDYALKLKPRRRAFQQLGLTRIRKKVVRRLDGHCKGLLEVGHARVSFLHRTVVDFLKTREMADYLSMKASPTFNANLSILRATLAFIKDTTRTILESSTAHYPVGDEISEVETQIKDAISLACQLEELSPDFYDTVEDILDDLEQSICKINCQTPQLIPCQAGETGASVARVFFRANLIQIGTEKYLKRKMAQDPDYLSELDEPPLTSWALPQTQITLREKRNTTLEFLLEIGENPNKRYTHTTTTLEENFWTPWTFFLSQVIKGNGQVDYNYLPRLDSDSFLTYLKHKADPNARIFRSTEAGVVKSSTAWVDFLLLCLDMKPGWVADSIYLEVLDAFLDGDVNLRDQAYIARSGETRFVYEAFFSSLKQRIQCPGNHDASDSENESSHPTIHPRRLRLWKAATFKLLGKSVGCAWPMEEIWPMISAVFGTKLQKLMRAHYESCCSGNPTLTTKINNKRGLEDLGEEETTPKILRVN